MRQGADLDQRLDLLGADAEQFASPPSAFATWQRVGVKSAPPTLTTERMSPPIGSRGRVLAPLRGSAGRSYPLDPIYREKSFFIILR